MDARDIENLLVPDGTALASGQLYMRLYHGRHDPEQDMDDWGFQGPLFGPLSGIVMTYLSTIRLYGLNLSNEIWIETHRDMVVWDGKYFGDFEIFVAPCSQRGHSETPLSRKSRNSSDVPSLPMNATRQAA